jgi:hypothetical protein
MSSEELNAEYVDPDYVDPDYVNNEYVSIPDWHMAILEERMERYKTADRTKWRTWEEVEKELMQAISEEIKRRKN